MGMNNIVYGKNSVATGLGNTVYGKGSAALGTNNTVMISQYPDYSAYAIGDNNQSVSRMTFAVGDNNVSDGTFSFTIGRRNQSHGSTSYAIGCDNTNTTMAFGCFAIGTNITNNNQNCITIGEHLENNTGGIMMGVNSTNSNRPTLFISKSSGSGATGRVGIGNVTDPQAKLHIKADNSEYAEILLDGAVSSVYFKDKNNSISVSGSQMIFAAPKYTFTNAGITLGKNATTQSPEISFGGANKISVGTDSNAMNFTAGGFSFTTGNAMSFSASSYSFTTGKVGIGCENTVEGYALAVNGGVVSTRVSVMDVDAWPDYVFGSDYERMSLYELEEYIGLNHHLPEVPSAEEVAEQGIDLGEMNALLLQKVEELTLHVIELQKQIDAQQNEINELKAK